MRNFVYRLAVCVVLAVAVDSTRVQHCKSGDDFADTTQISVSNCDEPTCRLRRKHDVVVELKFKPETNIARLRNSVHANIAGIPFPFIGVDGTNACDNLFQGDGSKASCPLTAGTEYVYKNSFKVLEFYPKVKLTVHWALTDASTNKDALCFTVDAKITS